MSVTGETSRPLQDQLDERIAQLTERLEGYKPRLDAACERWLGVVAEWLARRWDDDARAIVTGQPGTTKALQATGELAAARREIRALVADARRLARDLLVDEYSDRWPHRAAGPGWWATSPASAARSSSGLSAVGTLNRRGTHWRAPLMLRQPIRRALVRSAETMRAHGFHAESDAPDGRPVGVPADVAEALNAYADLHSEAIRTGVELDAARRHKACAEAATIWEEA